MAKAKPAAQPARERPRMSKRRKQRIFERDGFACKKCGATEELEIDHVHPWSKGGSEKDENLQTLCWDCNNEKRDKHDGMSGVAAEQKPLFMDGELAEAPGPLATEALATWNAIAPNAGWPEAKFLTASRRAAIKRAIPDYGGLAGWKTHLQTAATSDFLTGKSRRPAEHVNWRPDLDWFLKPANVVKILENKYAGVAPSASMAQVAPANRGVDWRGKLGRYKRGGFWHRETDGPRPEDPGPHLAPADMIEKWRRENNVSVTVAPVQSREARMAQTIAKLRELGQHERANRYEAELAALEGKPGTFIPHPSVDPRMGHNRPPGPITDVDEDPGWDSVPEGDPAMAEP